jgi:hypothetical protein
MDNNPKKRANKWLALINIPIQMRLSLRFPISEMVRWKSSPSRVYYNKILV